MVVSKRRKSILECVKQRVVINNYLLIRNGPLVGTVLSYIKLLLFLVKEERREKKIESRVRTLK